MRELIFKNQKISATVLGLVLGVLFTILGTVVIDHSMNSYDDSYKLVKPADTLLNNDVQYGARETTD